MGSVNTYDPTTGQLRRIVGDDNHLRDEMVAEYEPNSTASHAYSKGDQLIYNETLYIATKNIAIGDELSTEGISTWEPKTWDGLKPLFGSGIWTDGDDVYYSDGSSKQYVLNQDTLTWETMTWSGLTNFSAVNIWTDGTNTYFSNDSNQYVLNKATHTWEEKSWTGLTDFTGQYVWTDSGNIYYLEKTDWYVLDKNTSSWSAITWSAPTYFYGYYIWSDGENVYHSNGSEQYVLDRTTNKWTRKTWSGSLTFFYGDHVWEKDGSVYYSYDSNQYVFDKSLGEWVSTTWNGLNSFNGYNIWINKGTYYCSERSNAQYVFVTSEGNIRPSLSITEQLANTSTADNFIGTREQWAALTPEEQAKYNTMDFLGDSSSGGGGHTIVNSSGTEMTQRSKLKFTGCTVTDDSTNDETDIAVTPSSVGALATNGDGKNVTVTYTTKDADANITEKTNTTTDRPSTIAKLTSGETLASMFGKISAMFKNIRKLWNTMGTSALASGKTVTGLLGNTDISSVGSTVTKAISNLYSRNRRIRKDITSQRANLSTAISEQNLGKYGYAIGDYFVGQSGYVYHLADLNTFYGGYSVYSVLDIPHIAIVVDTKTTSKWNNTDSTTSGYNGSVLHSYLKGTVLNTIKSDMIALFGGSTGLEHLLSHQKLLTTAVSAWGWQTGQYISALSEVQLYSSRVWGIDGYQTGEACKPLEIFQKFRFNEIFGNQWFWLRDIMSSSYACRGDGGGAATYASASWAGSAVGLIIFN